MVQYNHFDYCRQLTLKLVLFENQGEKAFHRAPNSDTLLSISQKLSEINYPVLVAIDGKDADFEDNGAEQLLKKPQYFIMILKPANNDSPDSILSAQAESEAVAMQIMARMIDDGRKEINGLGALDISSFTIRSIGPIGDCLYGVVMAYMLESGVSYKIDNSYWK